MKVLFYSKRQSSLETFEYYFESCNLIDFRISLSLTRWKLSLTLRAPKWNLWYSLNQFVTTFIKISNIFQTELSLWLIFFDDLATLLNFMSTEIKKKIFEQPCHAFYRFFNPKNLYAHIFSNGYISKFQLFSY